MLSQNSRQISSKSPSWSLSHLWFSGVLSCELKFLGVGPLLLTRAFVLCITKVLATRLAPLGHQALRNDETFLSCVELIPSKLSH
jgi:hypothetical protein